MDGDAIQFYDRLKNEQLEQYFAKFTSLGISHLQSLSNLTMSDYAKFGINKAEDRKRLFLLIQNLKSHHSSMSSSIAWKTNLSNTNLVIPSFNGFPSSVGGDGGSASMIMKPPPKHLLQRELYIPPYLSATTSYQTENPFGKTVVDFKKSLSSIAAPFAKNSYQNDSYTATRNLSSANRSSPISVLSSPKNRFGGSADLSRNSPGLLNQSIPSPSIMNRKQVDSSSPLKSAKCEPLAKVGHSSAINLGRSGRKSSIKPPSTSYSQSRLSLDRSVSKLPLSSSQILKQPSVKSSLVPSNQTRSGLNVYGVPKSLASSSSSNNIKSKTTASQKNSSTKKNNDKIKVCVRKRPLSAKELSINDPDIINIKSDGRLSLLEPRMTLERSKYIEQHQFIFDDVFGEDASNHEVYEKTTKSLINTMFNGGRATCFVYGQTGSGKTFTILHPEMGLYLLAAKEILDRLSENEESLFLSIGFYEIYQGHLFDLLNGKKRIYARENKQHQVCIVGLTEIEISNLKDFQDQVDVGCRVRQTGVTGANNDSSRSHAILQFCLKNNDSKNAGMLSFIDLAGSERGADREDVDRQTKLEGSEINKSLLALKECIRAMDQDSIHLPFRQSKLTQVLKDSFVGDSKTCMIATVAPSQSNLEHTLNTLRYAFRVKEMIKGSTGDSENINMDSTPQNTITSNPLDQCQEDLDIKELSLDNESLLELESPNIMEGDKPYVGPTSPPRTPQTSHSRQKIINLPPIPGTPTKVT